MATLHYTNRFAWNLWDGPPPEIGSDEISTFARAGLNGVGHQHLGTRGQPFTVNLTAFLGSWNTAMLNIPAVLALKKLDLIDIWFNGVNMRTVFQTQYKCTEAKILAVKRHIFVGGIGYQAGALVASLTFVPHTKT